MEPYRHWFAHELLEEMAAASLSPTPSLVVSVDYDFFLPQPDLATVPDEIAEMLVAGLDWALEEWFSSERAAAAWQEFQDRLTVAGGDPDGLARADERCRFEDFADAVAKRFRFTEAFLADSHAWGSYIVVRAARGSGERVELVSFDAHHDCGYANRDSLARSRRRARERPSCDDWVQFGLVHDYLGHATVVYPDWRAGKARERGRPTLPPKHAGRLTRADWSTWPAARARAPDAATLLLVRSSAYIPPWLDHDARFLRLTSLLAPDGWQCLDCDPPLGIKIGAQDACTPRPFARRQGASPVSLSRAG